jgi:hypothetical protein
MKAPVAWSLAITAPDHLAFERTSVFADENADDSACHLASRISKMRITCGR